MTRYRFDASVIEVLETGGKHSEKNDEYACSLEYLKKRFDDIVSLVQEGIPICSRMIIKFRRMVVKDNE